MKQERTTALCYPQVLHYSYGMKDQMGLPENLCCRLNMPFGFELK